MKMRMYGSAAPSASMGTPASPRITDQKATSALSKGPCGTWWRPLARRSVKASAEVAGGGVGGGGAGRPDAARDAKVRDLEVAVCVDQQVGRLDVSVDDARRVQRREAAQQLPREEARVLLREQLVRLDEVPQVGVVQLGDEVELAPGRRCASARRQHPLQREQVRVGVGRRVAQHGELSQAGAQLQRVLGGPDALDRHRAPPAGRGRVHRRGDDAVRPFADRAHAGVPGREHEGVPPLALPNGVALGRHLGQSDGRPAGDARGTQVGARPP
mmetsp:Transcript_12796/g.37664  ORF Transcript_12796/g.37664 Transcript_12796/m.37664 type:complete len:272 (+) Transcript_12796:119-934(+)